MAFLGQTMNQFTQAPILGQVDLVPSPNVITAQIISTSSATHIQVGDAVKLVAGTSSTILVDICSGPTDGPVLGVIPYNERINLYSPGDLIEVAQVNTYVYLKSSAAIARGAKVTTTASTSSADPLVTTVSVPSTQYVTGIAVDTATAANQLLRIQISPSFNSGV
jgi:hypothetical protein